MPDKIDALERLGSLLDAGKLTRAEYEELKLEVLESTGPAGALTHASSSEVTSKPEGQARPRSTLTDTTGPYDAIDLLERMCSILVVALWVNAAYWALTTTIGFDLAFTPFFWGSSGAGDWIATIGSLYLWILIATGVLFVVWSYRAHASLRLLGRAGLQYQDHETAWWWVVPIANLVVPFKVIFETVRGIVAPLDDANWRSHPVPPLVPWWVGTLLGGILITAISSRLMNTASTIDEWTVGATAYTLGSAAMAAAAVLAAKLIRTMTQGQARQLRGLDRGGSPTTSTRTAPTGPQATGSKTDEQYHVDRLARGEHWRS